MKSLRTIVLTALIVGLVIGLGFGLYASERGKHFSAISVVSVEKEKPTGPIRRLVWWLFHRNDPPIPPDPVPPDPVPPDPVPPDPVPPIPPDPIPPPPPPPYKALNVIIAGPSPRAVRDLTPERAAILTSRTVYDYLAKACEKDEVGLPAFRIVSLGADTSGMLPRYQALLAKVPGDVVSVIARSGDKELLLSGDKFPADYSAFLSALAGVSGIKPQAAKPAICNPPEFTDEQWAKFKSGTGVVVFGGKPRFLTAKVRDLAKYPRGKAPGAVSLAEAGVRLIPRSEWPRYLAAKKAANAGLMPLLYNRLPCSDQASTNYCWANGPANCGATVRCVTGHGTYLLSAASIGGPITGYRNEGGWPADAIAFMQKTGCVRDSLWPNAAIDSRYAAKPEVQADYPGHMLVGLIPDLGGTGDIFAETVTCVLLGCPVATTHNWWGHAVGAYDFTIENSVNLIIERNSWGMDYGDQGFFKLREGHGSNQAGPDDGQATLLMKQASTTRLVYALAA